MAENRLVGSLILRTIDIDSTSNTLSTITTGPPVVYNNLDNTFGSSFANGALVVWKLLILEHVWENYIINTKDLT